MRAHHKTAIREFLTLPLRNALADVVHLKRIMRVDRQATGLPTLAERTKTHPSKGIFHRKQR